ncbi:hypothetical protein OF83DRAFT_1118178 [Amylostereum chailletii]|nr:hypothetical protein OF83DRAFT_1118178 [Amylostereum chailletii]
MWIFVDTFSTWLTSCPHPHLYLHMHPRLHPWPSLAMDAWMHAPPRSQHMHPCKPRFTFHRCLHTYGCTPYRPMRTESPPHTIIPSSQSRVPFHLRISPPHPPSITPFVSSSPARTPSTGLYRYNYLQCIYVALTHMLVKMTQNHVYFAN